MRANRPLLASAFLAAVAVTASAANLTPHGDFESGARGDRPPEFWHRGGDDYLSAYPDWTLTDAAKASGRFSVTTTSGREFVVCGEAEAGWITGSVSLRAEKADVKVRVRLSWWDRLTRSDTVETVAVGPDWRKVQVKAEAMQGHPVEIAVAAVEPGTRVWADDFCIEGTPVADQFVEERQADDQGPVRKVAPIRIRPVDLASLQTYEGPGKDSRGRVSLSVDAPEGCVEVPFVSGGVPMPRGALFRRERLRLCDDGGREAPAQFDVLSRWPADGSIMMVLVTAPTPPASAAFVLEYGGEATPTATGGALGVSVKGLTVAVQTGRANFAIGPETALPRVTGGDGRGWDAVAKSCRVEMAGPLRAVAAVEGDLLAPGGGERLGRFVTRYTVWRGSARMAVSHTWVHDEARPALAIQSAALVMPKAAAGGPQSQITQTGCAKRFGVSTGPIAAAPADKAEVRHDGLFDGRLAVRDFWQNHPMGFERAADQVILWLWPASVRGVFVPQGFARTWDFLMDPEGGLKRPYRTEAMPVLRADPEWMCASAVFERIMVPDPKGFPIFEQRLGRMETLGRFSRDGKEKGGYHGVFNYGDAPGDGGWSNLESMADHELFLHWMRQPSREHFDMARLAAEHYRDVDTHHGAGFCHVHCNNHVASAENGSHAWLQGTRDLYFLLGDLRALEVLHEFGERMLTRRVGWATGRDWTRPLDNLVDIYAATGDGRYLDCARKQLAELGRRQLPANAVCGAERGSWYEDRYTAGCAFTWYGCQAMAKFHALTGDPEALAILKKEIDLSMDVQTKSLRSMNILPDEKLSEDHAAAELGNFALGRGSTLFPPLGYLAQATGERRYLDFGMKVLAYYMLMQRGGSDASATAYATVFLHYARQAGLGAAEEAAAFQRARAFSYERWPAAVENGGFEMDSFRYWGAKKPPGKNEYYDSLVRVGYYLDEKVFRSGKRSLRLHSDNRTRVMSVAGSFRLEPRRRYRASLWVKADPSMNPRVSLGLYEYDADRRSGASFRSVGNPENGWQRHEAEFMTVLRSVATFSLSNAKGTGDVWFDDVAVEDLGPVHTLLTGNGLGRDGPRKPPHPDVTLATGGTYLPDKAMSTDTEPEGTPVSFDKGCLTDGVSSYDHLQKPRGSYAYWQGRPSGSIVFDLKREYRLRTVRVNVLIDAGRKSHGVKRIELRKDSATGPVLGVVETAVDGWNVFNLDTTAQKVALVLTRLEGRTYLTLSEVEIWGDAEK